MDVYIGGQCWPALIDSGAEVPVIHRRVLGEAEVSTVGNIFIQPIVGPAVEAKLVTLDVTKYAASASTEHPIASDLIAPPLHVTFAVTDMLNGHNVVIPASLAEELKASSQHSMHLPCVQMCSLHISKSLTVFEPETVREDDDVINDVFTRSDEVYYSSQTEIAECHNVHECTNSTNNAEVDCDIERDCVNVNVDVVTAVDAQDSSILSVNNDLSNNQPVLPVTRELLAKEQATDVTLAECRALANAQKGGYEWKDGLLYHIEKIHGFDVVQLVIPACKRNNLLQLVHIQCGFHQGQKHTLEHIRLSGLYFSGIKDAVNSFCNQCRPCAQTRGVLIVFPLRLFQERKFQANIYLWML
jgi:hypothetical protein